jgi:hypothetical protein
MVQFETSFAYFVVCCTPLQEYSLTNGNTID